MINYKLLEVAATFEDDSFKWAVEDGTENVVYFIHFSNSETYVGSTKDLHRRFSMYIGAFKNKAYKVKKVQEAFNDSESFKVYLLEQNVAPDKLRLREQFYIDALEPTLNTTKASTGMKKGIAKELRIKEVIKEKGLTITQVAESMGINRVNLSTMINGNPTVETLNKIADALNVPITDFFRTPEQTGGKGDRITFTCPHCHTVFEIREKEEPEKPF